ncbi:MAG: Asp-tRNA(Asn)/Glu-tRNA(Gln) amidotransferase GatCAB subunit C [Chloroflexi bacterium]|nr:Asp-tRNA(Asn)/Glu-tRNA(Gln) amidotransferase GatCAB subunit C [Chloroflexota bacterium]|tara:strand:- start:2218 stop:2508 length:291 start_codon:yes stop_codon:yes gene_type:complete
MEISKEEFENIANLSALSSDKINENLRLDLGKIISRFESLKKIDTSNIHPTAHVTNLENALREDISDKELDNENIMLNSPDSNSGQIKVPRVFENE